MKHCHDTLIMRHAEPAGDQMSRCNHKAAAQSWPQHAVPPMLAPSPSNPNLGEGKSQYPQGRIPPPHPSHLQCSVGE